MRLLSGLWESSFASSDGAPSVSTRPPSIVTTLSATGKTSSSLCSVSRIATPSSLFMRCTACRRLLAARGSSMDVGSSRIRSLGPIASAEARFISCFWPPESSVVLLRNHVSMPKNAAISATLRLITGTGKPMFSSPNASSCQT